MERGLDSWFFRNGVTDGDVLWRNGEENAYH